MFNIFDCCCSSQRYVVYVTGSVENKKIFYEKVFNKKLKDLSFSETLVTYNCTNLILLTINNEKDVKDVHEMHMKMANGIIILEDRDEEMTATKPTLFVKMNGRSRIEKEKNLIVCSVENDKFDESRRGVKKLTNMIKSQD